MPTFNSPFNTRDLPSLSHCIWPANPNGLIYMALNGAE